MDLSENQRAILQIRYDNRRLETRLVERLGDLAPHKADMLEVIKFCVVNKRVMKKAQELQIIANYI